MSVVSFAPGNTVVSILLRDSVAEPLEISRYRVAFQFDLADLHHVNPTMNLLECIFEEFNFSDDALAVAYFQTCRSLSAYDIVRFEIVVPGDSPNKIVHYRYLASGFENISGTRARRLNYVSPEDHGTVTFRTVPEDPWGYCEDAPF